MEDGDEGPETTARKSFDYSARMYYQITLRRPRFVMRFPKEKRV